MSQRTITLVARIIVMLWAGFWTFFCVASAFGEHERVIGALIHQVPAVIMLASLVIAWRLPWIGGVLLLLEGGFVASGVWLRPSTGLFLMLGLPPLVAGLLLLIAGPPAHPHHGGAASGRFTGT